MTRFRLITTWLMLLIPTLILGAGALFLLEGEEARLQDTARAAATDRIAAIAGNIDLAIAEVKSGLMATMSALPADGLLRQSDLLEEWKRSNPLVRNVFVWEKGRGLRYPDPERPASDEEAAFIRRYLPLFSSQAAWQQPQMESAAAIAAEEQVSNILSERRELSQLAKQAPRVAASPKAATPPSAAYSADAAVVGSADVSEPALKSTGRGDWRPWFADNRLHLFGWYEWQGLSSRVGVEVEMMALLSRLLGNFPSAPPDGETYALIDGNGNIFHQVGPLEIAADSRPLATIRVAGLPHWQLAAYPNPDSGVTDSGFLLIGSLLVGTFVVAILCGGSLLLWQAHRNQRDARQKTSFVSNVSHELKTPLTTIRMYAELLGEGKIEEPAKRQRYLQTIIRESQRLTRLVNNVLDFSRLEQGRKEYAAEPIDLSGLLHDLLDSQAVRIDEVGLNLVRTIAAGLSVTSDRDALEQIALNLLDNAMKYAASGGELFVDLEAVGTSVILRIRDRGPGIPADQQIRIFDKFHRLDASLTTSQQGTGLGLSIARQLAEGIGGKLSCCPHDGGGACFELTLPREESA